MRLHMGISNAERPHGLDVPLCACSKSMARWSLSPRLFGRSHTTPILYLSLVR